MMHKAPLIIFLLLLNIFGAVAGERFSKLTVSADIGFSPALYLAERQKFEGEFFPSGGFLTPEWQSYDVREKLSSTYTTMGINGRLSFNFFKNLQAGITYRYLSVRNLERPGISGSLFAGEENTFFFFAGLEAGYIIRPFSRAPNFTLIPAVGGGTYLSSGFYSGPGSQWFLHSNLKVQYAIKNRFAFFVCPAYTHWQYKEKGYSNFFERSTLDLIRLNSFQMEAGFSFLIHIERKP